jgi:hypothetical protein
MHLLYIHLDTLYLLCTHWLCILHSLAVRLPRRKMRILKSQLKYLLTIYLILL